MAALGMSAVKQTHAMRAAAIGHVPSREAAGMWLDCPVTRPAAHPLPVPGTSALGRPYQRRVPLGMYFFIRLL